MLWVMEGGGHRIRPPRARLAEGVRVVVVVGSVVIVVLSVLLVLAHLIALVPIVLAVLVLVVGLVRIPVRGTWSAPVAVSSVGLRTSPSDGPLALCWGAEGLVGSCGGGTGCLGARVGDGGRWWAMGPIPALRVDLGSGEGVLKGAGGRWWVMGSIPAPRVDLGSGEGVLRGAGGRWRAMGPIPAPRADLGSWDGVLGGEGGRWWAMGPDRVFKLMPGLRPAHPGRLRRPRPPCFHRVVRVFVVRVLVGDLATENQ